MAQARLTAELTALLGAWHAEPSTVDRAAADIVDRYREPHRCYHTLHHVDEALSVAHDVGADDVVVLAVWFHDVVYDATATDSEARSALFARDTLSALGAPPDIVDEVARLVLTTVSHDPVDGDVRAAQLADADLAVLGAPPERYARYVDDVRSEYAHVDDDAWRAGRAAVLATFLARDRLYHDDRLRDRLEQRARDNLRTELAALSP